MGKDLKGKELGVGISQRRDGLYTARFTAKNGKRRQAYFKKLQECRNWIAEKQFDDEHGNVLFSKSPTVDAWFDYWITDIKSASLKDGSIKEYKTKYKTHIQPAIGNMLLEDIKPLHCQSVLAKMANENVISVIRGTRFIMLTMFASAIENGLISTNPVTRSVQARSKKAQKNKEALTVEEQILFMSAAQEHAFYVEWALILQTGLRVGELTALKWSDIDFKGKIIHVNKTMTYDTEIKEWRVGTPKTKAGTRDIPMTQEAIRLLKKQLLKDKSVKVVPLQNSELVFLNKNGEPTKSPYYDQMLMSVCRKAGIRKISMHILRHTYATRCIEAGMRPKTLQTILGHSNLSMTMDLYVHVTNDARVQEVEMVEGKLKLV